MGIYQKNTCLAFTFNNIPLIIELIINWNYEMTGKFFRHTTRYDFLAHLWKIEKVRTVPELIKRVKQAEEEGTLVIKRAKNKTDDVYEKNIRWYMGKLERDGKIKGFLGPVGRPSKNKKKTRYKK